MFKIIMCDDEPWALKGIENIIDWRTYGFTNVQTFVRADQAYRAILQTRPDVVITDVRMPVMSGLDIIENCREEGCEPLFVIVSAYAQFEYAQRALDNGAFSYILKPYEVDVIIELVQKLRNTLLERRQIAFEQKVRSLLLNVLYSIELDEPDFTIENKGLFSQPYRVCVTDQTFPLDSAGWYQIHIGLAVGILSDGGRSWIPILCGLSGRSVNASTANKHIREALIAYYTLCFYGKTVGRETYHAPDNSSLQVANDIHRTAASGDLKYAQKLLQAYEKYACENMIMIDELMLFYNGFLIGLSLQLEVRENLHAFSNCFQMYGVFGTVQVFFESVNILIEDCLYRATFSGGVSNVVEQVIYYVNTHYQEAFTLEQLSRKFNISLSHLCRQFKRSTGVTFTEYVGNKRIQNACEMLRGTALPIAEVGVRVGYSDYFYFSRVFKRVVGCSPSAYRKVGKNEQTKNIFN